MSLGLFFLHHQLQKQNQIRQRPIELDRGIELLLKMKLLVFLFLLLIKKSLFRHLHIKLFMFCHV